MSFILQQPLFKAGSSNMQSHKDLLRLNLQHSGQEVTSILKQLLEQPSKPEVACLDIWIFTNARKIWNEFKDVSARIKAVQGRILYFFKELCEHVQERVLQNLLHKILVKMGFKF